MQLGSLGFPELLVILFVVLLLFGPKRLPEVSRGLGKAVRDFRKGLESGLEEVEASTRAARQPEPDQDVEPEPASSEPAAAAPPSPAAPEVRDAASGEPHQDPPARAA